MPLGLSVWSLPRWDIWKSKAVVTTLGVSNRPCLTPLRALNLADGAPLSGNSVRKQTFYMMHVLHRKLASSHRGVRTNPPDTSGRPPFMTRASPRFAPLMDQPTVPPHTERSHALLFHYSPQRDTCLLYLPLNIPTPAPPTGKQGPQQFRKKWWTMIRVFLGRSAKAALHPSPSVPHCRGAPSVSVCPPLLAQASSLGRGRALGMCSLAVWRKDPKEWVHEPANTQITFLMMNVSCSQGSTPLYIFEWQLFSSVFIAGQARLTH